MALGLRWRHGCGCLSEDLRLSESNCSLFFLWFGSGVDGSGERAFSSMPAREGSEAV